MATRFLIGRSSTAPGVTARSLFLCARVSPSPQPLDSWHMVLQSGRLLVPQARANSCSKNAASLLSRPEV
jgi:hypothetical protein